jgi:hypothetical protein
MSPSLTLPRLSPTRTRPSLAPYLAAAAYLALVLPFVPRAVHQPAHVPRVVVTNDTSYGVTVEVLDHGARIPVGSLQPDRTATFGEVADVGAQWALVWSARGHEVTTTTSRAALQDADWKVSVPATLGNQLDAEGEAPTPG